MGNKWAMRLLPTSAIIIGPGDIAACKRSATESPRLVPPETVGRARSHPWFAAIRRWLDSATKPARESGPQSEWPEPNPPNPRTFENRLVALETRMDALEADVRSLKQGMQLLLNHLTAKTPNGAASVSATGGGHERHSRAAEEGG
jgi:hypothetical protein